MNGIINVLKPPGMTSHDVIAFIRKTLGIKKAGHTGTLDPEAAGVLPVCIGKATKAVQYLSDRSKRYRANIKFGAVTDTYDSYGKILKETTSFVSINSKKIEEILISFTGPITQRPPMFSALKLKGKKLYQYAREGKEVQIPERTVEIYEIRLVDILSENEAMIDVLCSKGTYIRSLCFDIGEALGCGAHMSQLVRLEVFPFTIENSNTLEEISIAAKDGRFTDIVINTEVLFRDHKPVIIKPSAQKSVLNGGSLFQQGVLKGFEELEANDRISLYKGSEFIGIGNVCCDKDGQRLYIKTENIFI